MVSLRMQTILTLVKTVRKTLLRTTEISVETNTIRGEDTEDDKCKFGFIAEG